MNREQLFKEIKNFTVRKSNDNNILIYGLDSLSKKATELLKEAIIYDQKTFLKSQKRQLLFYQEYLLPILSLCLYYNEHLISTQNTPTNPSAKNSFLKKQIKKYTTFLSLNDCNIEKLDSLLYKENNELLQNYYVEAPIILRQTPLYPTNIDALIASLPPHIVLYANLTTAKQMISIHNNSTLLSLLDKFVWRGKYNTMAIFIYNLYYTGAMGNGDLKKHEVISFFSLAFSCDFSKVYHQSIRDLQSKGGIPPRKE